MNVENAESSPNSNEDKGFFRCEVCRVRYRNVKWRKEKQERQICQNGHAPIKMRHFESDTHYLVWKFPLEPNDKLNEL